MDNFDSEYEKLSLVQIEADEFLELDEFITLRGVENVVGQIEEFVRRSVDIGEFLVVITFDNETEKLPPR